MRTISEKSTNPTKTAVLFALIKKKKLRKSLSFLAKLLSQHQTCLIALCTGQLFIDDTYTMS